MIKKLQEKDSNLQNQLLSLGYEPSMLPLHHPAMFKILQSWSTSVARATYVPHVVWLLRDYTAFVSFGQWHLLGYQDSNLEQQRQKLLCYRYTITQFKYLDNLRTQDVDTKVLRSTNLTYWFLFRRTNIKHCFDLNLACTPSETWTHTNITVHQILSLTCLPIPTWEHIIYSSKQPITYPNYFTMSI